MGCGSSQSASTSSLGSGHDRPKKDHPSPSSLRKQVLIAQSDLGPRSGDDQESMDGGEPGGQWVDSRSTGRDSGIDSAKTNDGQRAVQLASLESPDRQRSVPTPLAFDVAIGEQKAPSIVKQHPPKRLQMMDAKETKVTAEMLAERQRVADERRIEELKKRAKSAKHTSRLRKDILAAKEFGDSQAVDAHQKKLEDKTHSAEKNKAQHTAENQAKQKLRELKRSQVREKAKRLQQQMKDEDSNFDMEKDDTFNVDDDTDSWLDGDNNTDPQDVKGSASTSNSERIYDGRSSPTKRFHPLSSAEVRRRQHSLGSESEDEDTSGNQWASASGNAGTQDNFFDT